MKKIKNYWIYILECSNGSYYTGYTNDIKKRFSQHVAGSGKAKYTRSFKPVRIVQLWKLEDIKANAMKVEAFIKSNNRKYKEDLIKNPGKLKKAMFDRFGLKLNLYKERLP